MALVSCIGLEGILVFSVRGLDCLSHSLGWFSLLVLLGNGYRKLARCWNPEWGSPALLLFVVPILGIYYKCSCL